MHGSKLWAGLVKKGAELMTDSMHGQPWKIEKTFDSYEAASNFRDSLASETLSAKVKLTATGLFTVRTRATVMPQKETKKKKSKKEKKTNS